MSIVSGNKIPGQRQGTSRAKPPVPRVRNPKRRCRARSCDAGRSCRRHPRGPRRWHSRSSSARSLRKDLK